MFLDAYKYREVDDGIFYEVEGKLFWTKALGSVWN